MTMNKLLERQVQKYLDGDCRDKESIAGFIHAVNNSYNSFEKDLALSAQAFRITEEEYIAINDRLTEEIHIRKLGIKNLKEAIRSIDDSATWTNVVDEDENNLIDTLAYLKDQILKRKKVETDLKDSENRLKRLSLVASANENGVAFCHADGTIFWANEGFSRLTGYTAEDAIGRTPVELFKGPLSDRSILRAMVDDFMVGENFDVEVIHYRKDGSWFWGRAKGQAILDEEGKLVQYFAIIEDITDRKNVEAALIEARESAEESSQAKEIFLANMSHEIRTPMNAILGMSRQLQKTELFDKQRQYLDTIRSAAENLLVIINDILDISKIEAGKLTLEKIGFRMQDVLNRVKGVMLHKAEEKGLRLSLSIGDEVASILRGDPYRLNQILLNLVSNAVKFTERGSVTITCWATERTGCQQVINMTVSDTGIGMEEEFLHHLFQKFLQEDKTVARKYGGTGLGMSISKQLVELMDGSIGVTSGKGRGTDILLTITFDIGDESDLTVGEEAPADASILKGKKILLVEDNQMNRLLAGTILSHYGAIVNEAVDGREAVEAVKQHAYDLILMDVQMPVMDGREATRQIRRDLDKKIPIVALTANAIKGEMDICLAAGMNDYVSKPFEEEDLIKIICQWLGKDISIDVRKKEAKTDFPLYSLEQLEIAGRGDAGFVQKMLRLAVDQLPASIEEIKTAYGARQFNTIKSVAHRIKPVLSNLCVNSLKEDIREIELLAKENQPSPRLEQLIVCLDTIASKVTSELSIKLNKL